MHQEQQDLIDLSITWREQSPAEFMTQAGEWLELQENAEAALAYYKAALKLDPQFGLAAWRFAKLALTLNRYSDAAEKVEQAIRSTPDHTPTYHLASQAYFALEQYERSLAYAEETLARAPLHPGAFRLKLRSLAQLNRWEELVETMQTASAAEQSPENKLFHALALAAMSDIAQSRTVYESVHPKHRRRFPELSQRIEGALA